MNRKEFQQKFNIYFQKNENRIFHFNILIKESSNEVEFNESLHQFFIPFFKYIKIKNKYQILNKIKLNKSYDSYYEEDNPNSEFCAYNCQINVNELFDIIKKENNIKSELIEVFRIENKDGKGLYDTGFAAKKVNANHHPAPIDDINFNGIFDKNTNDYNYQKQWYFGFKSLDNLKKWLLNEHNQKELENNGSVIKKYLIEEDYVIEGNKQLIFKKENIEKVFQISWNEIKINKLKIILKG